MGAGSQNGTLAVVGADCHHEEWGFPAPAWNGGLVYSSFACHAIALVYIAYTGSAADDDTPRPKGVKTVAFIAAWQFYRFVGGIACLAILVGPVFPNAWVHPLSGDVTVGSIAFPFYYMLTRRRGLMLYVSAVAYFMWAAWDLCAAAFTDGMDKPHGVPVFFKWTTMKNVHGWISGWLLGNAAVIYLGAVRYLIQPELVKYYCEPSIPIIQGTSSNAPRHDKVASVASPASPASVAPAAGQVAP